MDKSTFNLTYLGLIHRAFPNARIICLLRNPVDTCLSCYFHNFVNCAAFTLDLDHLAHYYTEHLKLIEHWQTVLPSDSFMLLSYEALVREQESWSRKILEFLGLEWNSAVLNFHETERVVRTASIWQVRQKLYTNAIGRSAAYQKWLGPLLKLDSSRYERLLERIAK